MTDKRMLNVVARAVTEELMKLDVTKPWAEMDDTEKSKFKLLLEIVLFKVTKMDDELAGWRWPTMLMMMRRHGREMQNLYTEWQIDPDQFMKESMRQAELFAANLDAHAKEHDMDDWREGMNVDEADYRLMWAAIFEKYEQQEAQQRS